MEMIHGQWDVRLSIHVFVLRLKVIVKANLDLYAVNFEVYVSIFMIMHSPRSIPTRVQLSPLNIYFNFAF